jgi:hypothetical protein
MQGWHALALSGTGLWPPRGGWLATRRVWRSRSELDPRVAALPGVAWRIVCTIKFQGDTDHDAAAAFAAIPGGRVMRLFHNKHELTFVWARGGRCNRN